MDERLSLDSSDPGSIAQHLARYEYFSAYAKGKNVLDAACGTGYGSLALLRGGAKSYTGIDISPDAVAASQKKYAGASARFVQKSVLDLQGFGSFDLIISFETIEHIREYNEFLRAVAETLPDHGEFIVSTPIRHSGRLEDQPRNPFHTQEWTEEEFRTLLAEKFQVVDAFYQYGYAAPDTAFAETWARRLWKVLLPTKHKRVAAFPVVKTAKEVDALIPLKPIFLIAVCKKKIK